MSNSSNPYELTVFVRYALAGIVILFVAIKSIEKEREQLLKKVSKKYEKHFLWWFKIRVGILRLPYSGRVAVLVISMELYCFMLVYFKMDETSTRRERKVLYELIKVEINNELER